jgi:CO/xanthine dehydrogenase Mo-binding subunit
MGLAMTHTNNAYIAIVADVAVSRAGALTLKKLTAAVDAGTIINLSAAEAQIQGAMLDGISAAWFQKITIEHGAAAQTNFDEYPMLRMNHAPLSKFISRQSPTDGLGGWSAGRRSRRLQRHLRRDWQARAHAAHHRRGSEMIVRTGRAPHIVRIDLMTR